MLCSMQEGPQVVARLMGGVMSILNSSVVCQNNKYRTSSPVTTGTSNLYEYMCFIKKSRAIMCGSKRLCKIYKILMKFEDIGRNYYSIL